MIKERKGIDPVVLKLGLALALSFAVFLYSRIKTKRIKQLPPPSTDCDNQVDSHNMDGSDVTLNMATCQVIPFTSTDSYEPPPVQVSLENNSPRLLGGGQNIDEDGLLLPEFNDLINELEKPDAGLMMFSGEDMETPKCIVAGVPKVSIDMDEYEDEIQSLKNMVGLLRERERHLEVQLLQYHGLKEQEKVMAELQNRLKTKTVEAKLLSLRIESLQAENKRMEAQVADYAEVVAELEEAKGKIKLLRKKLKNETAETKEQILRLRQRVGKLRENDLVSDAEIHSKLQRLEELEAESMEVRKKNLDLQLENSELARRLESNQLLATSILEDPDETAELRREVMHLRQDNENLMNEIKRLKSDRCVDVEELVYLRWINACLRHELRNYQPPLGKTIARDLSKTLSPRSEEKAKQLILEYANTQGEANTVDLDYDRWSSSQSDLTDSPEASITDVSSSSKTYTSSKAKFFGKLRRLILGKHVHHHGHDGHQHHHHQRRVSTMTKARSVDNFVGNEERSGDVKSPRNWRYFMSSGRSSIELGMLPSLYEEDTRDMNGVHVSNDSGSIQNTELWKYAEVLRHSMWTRRAHRRAASYGP
ncbi:hypothetical protein Droror1_Dr00006441 [Drosera rotundifolia]